MIHHGKPIWLGKQHIDIFLPEYNIAVEYQGAQHFEAIEYFGGDKGFQDTVKRDKKKQRLCEQNDCELIYVLEGYDSSQVLSRIRDLIQSKKQANNDIKNQ